MKITLLQEEVIEIKLNDLLEKLKDGKFTWDGKEYKVSNVDLHRMTGTIKIREVK